MDLFIWSAVYSLEFLFEYNWKMLGNQLVTPEKGMSRWRRELTKTYFGITELRCALPESGPRLTSETSFSVVRFIQMDLIQRVNSLGFTFTKQH